MSKMSNALNLLKILLDGRTHKIEELAEKIEVKPRTIRTYKKELEMAGIYIESTSGRYGGYRFIEAKSVYDALRK